MNAVAGNRLVGVASYTPAERTHTLVVPFDPNLRPSMQCLSNGVLLASCGTPITPAELDRGLRLGLVHVRDLARRDQSGPATLE